MQRTTKGVFIVAIFTGSFLLFNVQPMVARMALPKLGGAPNVWNSAMLVYQSLLLAGYAYAHLISRFAVRRQAVIHLAVLLAAALTLPLGLAKIAPPIPGLEVLWVPWLFLLSVGPVFFAVSAQAPMLQRWFHAQEGAGDPYSLYAASNLGSFAGLLAYPLLAEPLLTLRTQARLWTAGYILLLALMALLGLSRSFKAEQRTAQRDLSVSSSEAQAIGWRRQAMWIALAAVPSGLMLSTTTFLTTDIMAIPLLWVIPLGLYLLSFTIAFAASRKVARGVAIVAPLVLLACAPATLGVASRGSLMPVILSLIALFVASVALHTRLYEDRPPASQLTRFYLFMSAGGAIGGLFTALVAPLVFDWTWEYPLLLVAVTLLVPLGPFSAALDRLGWRDRLTKLAMATLALIIGILIGTALINPRFLPYVSGSLVLPFMAIIAAPLIRKRQLYAVAFTIMVVGLTFPQTLLTLKGARSRSYFGIYTVRDTGAGLRQLFHGTTMHGMQWRLAGRETEATSYYGAQSGIGRTLAAADGHARIAVVGLGVGTLACYRKPGQSWSFYEIDPVVRDYSRRHTFTFVDRCAPQARIVIGDARLRLLEAQPGSIDILAVDAFSSDAIPLHLLTREALSVYLRALSPHGVILFHISNKFIDLEPVLSAHARDMRIASAGRFDWTRTDSLSRSFWIAMSRDPARISALTEKGGWRALKKAEASPWLDDHASILPFIKWHDIL